MLTMKRLTNTDIVKQLSVIIFFIITSLLFFSPVLKGKKILQNDIVQYSGMSKELNDFRDKNDKRPTGLIMHFRECHLSIRSKIPAQLYQTTRFVN